MQLNSSTPFHRIFLAMPPCSGFTECTLCDAELCLHANRVLEATHLIRLGARAGLTSQLTGLERSVTNQLYLQLHGAASPPGQVPFTDTWYRKSDRRMLHTNIIWRLHQKLSQTERSKGRILIDVFQAYTHLVTEPLLDLTRTAFVLQLVTMETWHERKCGFCELDFATPIESNSTACPGCLLYYRHRCIQCGAALSPKPKGRDHANCWQCGAELMGGIRH